MRILAVDVGTGTQDILLFDTDLEPENCFKMVMPSPTMAVARRIKAATRQGEPLLLTGVTMGGGPSAWAARDHVLAGHQVYATPDAARSFNDDLEAVQADMGVRIIGEDEAAALRRKGAVTELELRDFDSAAIAQAFASFGLDLYGQYHLDLVVVAVFDHGNAPPGYSDRQFRFDYLAERLAQTDGASSNGDRASLFSTFAFRAQDIPLIMTRMQAVADAYAAAGSEVPLAVMDTAPAAVLGALLDPDVGRHEQLVVANVGNFHTLAFRLGAEGIEGLFEHHTGLIDQPRLDDLIGALAAGTLTHETVFDDHGHGALLTTHEAAPLEFLCITGPRRGLMRSSRHMTHFAVPYGDMMIAGCFGLVRVCADLWPASSQVILSALRGTDRGAPWEYL